MSGSDVDEPIGRPSPTPVRARAERPGRVPGPRARPDAPRRRPPGRPRADSPVAIDERLRAACAQSLELGAASSLLRQSATCARLSSRPRGHYARVSGTIGGVPVTGLVRRDGTLAGDLALLARAGRPGSPVRSGETPLLLTVRLARACDSVTAVNLFRAGQRNVAAPAGAAMHAYDSEPGMFSVTEHDLDGAHVVSFFGDLDLAAAARAEEAIVRDARRTVVVDLSGLTFLDAGGLRAIIGAKRRLEADGSTLRLEGAVGIVRRTFDVTNLAHLLEN